MKLIPPSGPSITGRLDEEDIDPQIQMSPVKHIIPTETFLGNLGNHPSSLFGQSTSSSPFKHPGSGSSSRNSAPATNQVSYIFLSF